MRLVVSLLLFGSIFCAPFVATAQSSDVALAEALFQDGRRLMLAQRYDEACPKFEESYRLVKKLGTLLNLGTCHDKQGKTASAWGELTEAVLLAKEAGEKQRVEYARKLVDDLEKRLSKLVVEVPNAPTDAEVKVDDAPIGRAAWGTPIPLDPGEHRVVVVAPGFEAWEKTVTLTKEPGTLRIEAPALKPAKVEAAPETRRNPPVAAPVETASPGTNTAQLVSGVVIGGLGLVSIGVGSYFGIATFDKQSESEDHCVETRCDAAGVALREDAATFATVSTATFVVGGVAVAGGLVLALTAVDWSEGGKEPVGSAWLPCPWVSAEGAGLALGGAF